MPQPRRNNEKDIPHIDDCGTFEIYTSKIKTYLEANSIWNWYALEHELVYPTQADSNGGPPTIKPPESWTEAEKQLVGANLRVKNILQKSVSDSLAQEIAKVPNAKAAWELVQTKFKKHASVRTQNLYNLMRQFDKFTFFPGEKVSEAKPRFDETG